MTDNKKEEEICDFVIKLQNSENMSKNFLHWKIMPFQYANRPCIKFERRMIVTLMTVKM